MRHAAAHSTLLPGGQYARGLGRSLSPCEGYCCGSRGAFLYCQRQLCWFVGVRSADGQARRMWVVGQGSSLAWLTIRIGQQGRKPGERNKLFDLFYRHRTLIRPIR